MHPVKDFRPENVWITADFMECEDYECFGFGKVHCIGSPTNGPFGNPFKGDRFWGEYFPSQEQLLLFFRPLEITWRVGRMVLQRFRKPPSERASEFESLALRWELRFPFSTHRNKETSSRIPTAEESGLNPLQCRFESDREYQNHGKWFFFDPQKGEVMKTYRCKKCFISSYAKWINGWPYCYPCAKEKQKELDKKPE